MPLSKEFYLDEIKSKHPNSYNDSLKDLPVKDLADMLDFLDEALGKADGGSIGIEVLFGPKREDFRIGGRAQRKVPYDSRATAQDFANALQSVSAGTTYQQQADAKRYARQQASSMLNQAMKSADPNKGPGLQGIYDTFFRNKNTGIGPSTFTPGASGRMMSYSSKDRDRILDQMANQMLSTTSYGGGTTSYGVGTSAPDPFQKQRAELERIKTDNKRIFDEYVKNNPPQLGIITGPGGKPPSPGLPPYQDQKLLDQLTKLTPLQATYFDPFDQLSDTDQYNLSLAFPELKSQLRNPNQPRLAVMPDPQELFSRRYGIKDGGRVGLFMGGDPLTGQALAIYNSMNAYGFSDQEIANALEEQGYYTPGDTTTPDAPTTIQPIDFQSNNERGGGITELTPYSTGPVSPRNQSNTSSKYSASEIEKGIDIYGNPIDESITSKGFIGRTMDKFKTMGGNLIDKFSGSKIGEGATKFKNFAITPMMALMQKRNPLNPGASNYNPNLQPQMDFLKGITGTKITGTSGNLKFIDNQLMIGKDPNTGLAKYGPGSVLSGQNVVSGFGTNDYEKQLEKYIDKMISRRTKGVLSEFQQKKLDAAYAELKAEQERAAAAAELAAAASRAESARQYNPAVHGATNYGLGSDGQQSYSGDAVGASGLGFGVAAGGYGGPVSNKTGKGRTGYSKGGLATMFKRKR